MKWSDLDSAQYQFEDDNPIMAAQDMRGHDSAYPSMKLGQDRCTEHQAQRQRIRGCTGVGAQRMGRSVTKWTPEGVRSYARARSC